MNLFLQVNGPGNWFATIRQESPGQRGSPSMIALGLVAARGCLSGGTAHANLGTGLCGVPQDVATAGAGMVI